MRIGRHRLSVLAAGATLVLAACGGGDDSSSGALPTAGAESTGDAAAEPGVSADAPASGDSPAVVDPASLLPTQVDLVGEAVVPEAEIESNLLPPVVLDDVTTGRKVNFRNLVPQDKPILLWMYAPH